MDLAFKNIALFGGTNGVGKECLKKALKDGYNVTVLARNPSKIADIQHPNLKIIKGDVLDSQAVQETVKANEVVCNCLGANSLKGPGWDLCSKGTENIVKAMKENGLKKIITCTSLGTGDSYPKCSLFTKFFIWAIISRPIQDKEVQEKIIKESGLDFVIIRPSGLTNNPFTGKYQVGFDVNGGRVARADVGDWIIRQVNSAEWVGKCPSITGN